MTLKPCPQNIVSIRNVNKSYQRGAQTVPVLEDITFEICDGEFLALMGPSGSGKSTLLNILAGIDKADSGTVTIGGVDITALSETDLAQWRASTSGSSSSSTTSCPCSRLRERGAAAPAHGPLRRSGASTSRWPSLS